eukprot:COSAG01_NODE_15439_length_1337_cov_1.636511_2_plen_145_part_00
MAASLDEGIQAHTIHDVQRHVLALRQTAAAEAERACGPRCFEQGGHRDRIVWVWVHACLNTENAWLVAGHCVTWSAFGTKLRLHVLCVSHPAGAPLSALQACGQNRSGGQLGNTMLFPFAVGPMTFSTFIWCECDGHCGVTSRP